VSEQEKKSERYNTVFLVSQLQAEQSRNKKIGIAVAVVILIAVVYLIFVRQPSTEAPHSEVPAAAPAQGTTLPPANPDTPAPTP
jgi:type II secretory pathway component PulM